MLTEKQLEANRRNAQRSTGPRTPEGKARSSRNNFRHGLTGQIILMPDDEREAHDAYCQELIDSLHPETPIERDLARSIAEDSWRLTRIFALETNMFALGHGNERGEIRIALADARTFMDNAAKFNLLSLYEQRINRNRERSIAFLRQLQAERKSQQAQAPARANPPVVAIPAARKNGFVFSNAPTPFAPAINHAPNPPESPERVHSRAA